MKETILYCKYCANYRVAVYGPMNSGYCVRDPFEIVYNDDLGLYERRITENLRDKDPKFDGKGPCSSYKPFMPIPTQEWFQKIFDKEL